MATLSGRNAKVELYASPSSDVVLTEGEDEDIIKAAKEIFS